MHVILYLIELLLAVEQEYVRKLFQRRYIKSSYPMMIYTEDEIEKFLSCL